MIASVAKGGGQREEFQRRELGERHREPGRGELPMPRVIFAFVLFSWRPSNPEFILNHVQGQSYLIL